MTDHLIVYAKRPIAGYTKTRLAAGIGAEEAAGVYARMLYTLLEDISRCKQPSLSCTLSLASAEDIPFFCAAYPEWNVTHQVQGDLGFRMTTSILEEIKNGAEKVILVGSGIPFLSHDHIKEAVDALDNVDVVFGPTNDGGFYLVGTKGSIEGIFEDIAWSTPSVLPSCIHNAEAQHLKVKCITELFDMDTDKEYSVWKARLMGRK